MVTSEPITKVFITRTEEHSVQQELRIPQELINHPRLKEIITHAEAESAEQLQVLNLIPESTQKIAQQLLDQSKLMLAPSTLDTVDVVEPVSKLKQMLHESDIHIPYTPHVGERTSKVLAEEGARYLVVCKSNKLNQAHVTSHVQYSKEKEVSLRFARSDLSKQRVTHALSQAQDLVLEIQPKMVQASELKKHKRALMIQLIEDGWNVLGLLPKD